MKRTLIITLIAAALRTASSLHAEDVAQSSINPALLYWQAAALLPSWTGEESRELRDLADGHTAFQADRAAKFVHEDSALHLIQQAANSTASCDWGLPVEDGPMLALPHISRIREMSSVAVVKAESLFAESKTTEGIEWLMIAHRMARHAGAGDYLVPNLVQLLIEGNVINTAARHCLSWDEKTRHAYAAMLKALPPLHSTQDAYRGERALIDWTERRLLAGDAERHELEEILKASVGPDQTLGKDALAQVPRDKVPEAIGEWRSLQSRAEAAFGQPYPQAHDELKTLAEEAAHNPYLLISGNFPPTTRVADKQFALATLRTMLEAALEYGSQLNETTIANYRDSFEGERLELEKSKDGTFTIVVARPRPAAANVSLKFGK